MTSFVSLCESLVSVSASIDRKPLWFFSHLSVFLRRTFLRAQHAKHRHISYTYFHIISLEYIKITKNQTPCTFHVQNFYSMIGSRGVFKGSYHSRPYVIQARNYRKSAFNNKNEVIWNNVKFYASKEKTLHLSRAKFNTMIGRARLKRCKNDKLFSQGFQCRAMTKYCYFK